MMGDAKFIEVLMKNIFSHVSIKMGTYDTLSKDKISFIKGKVYLDRFWWKKYIFAPFTDIFMARLQNDKNGRQRLDRFVDLINVICTKSRAK